MSYKKEFFSSPQIFKLALQFLEILFPTFESRGTEFTSLLGKAWMLDLDLQVPETNTQNLLKNKYTVPSLATAPKIDC